MHTESQKGRLGIAAIIAAASIGEFIFYVAPFVVGGSVQAFGVTEGTAGQIVAIELGAAALLALIVASQIAKLQVGYVVGAALAAVAVGDVTALLTNSLSWYIPSRALAGAGAGTLLATANAVGASNRNPQRLFSMMQFAVVATTVVGFSLVPLSIEIVGPKGVIAVRVLIALLLGGLLFWIPAGRDGVDSSQPVLSSGRGYKVVTVLAAVVLIWLGNNGLWAYVERIGASLAFSVEQISMVLLATSVFALSGPACAQLLGSRRGLLAPIGVSALLQAAGAFALVHAGQLFGFALGSILYSAAFMFCVPYFKAAMAALDSSGRIVGSGAALMIVGTAIGPGIFGVILNAGGSYATLGWVATCCFAMGWCLAVPAATTTT